MKKFLLFTVILFGEDSKLIELFHKNKKWNVFLYKKIKTYKFLKKRPYKKL